MTEPLLAIIKNAVSRHFKIGSLFRPGIIIIIIIISHIKTVIITSVRTFTDTSVM